MLTLIKKICAQLETIICILKGNVCKHDAKSLNNIDLYYTCKPAAVSLSEGFSGELLDIRDVMERLGISESTYYRFVRNGELKPRKKGRRHYYYLSDLHEQLKESIRRGRT